jgi:hypothetical protein
MADKAAELHKAVLYHDTETSLKLLESAGGACQVRDLAKSAQSQNLMSDFQQFGYKISENANQETLTVFVLTTGVPVDLASLTQSRCQR